MDRKDVYDHLAKIYLDASSKTKRRKKHKDYPVVHGLLIALAVGILSLSLFFLLYARKNRPMSSELALVFAPEAVKINFNFNPAKKETYSLNLSNIDFRRYKTLAFSVRKMEARGNISLRVELINPYRETAEVYLRNISNKWEDYRIKLADFKGLYYWPKISAATFTVEEWNADIKHGVVYIDNIRLLK